MTSAVIPTDSERYTWTRIISSRWRASMAKLASDYPTEQQIREMYEAYESGRPGAIAEVLRNRKREREESRAESAEGTPDVE
jgi:hypothetical protein